MVTSQRRGQVGLVWRTSPPITGGPVVPVVWAVTCTWSGEGHCRRQVQCHGASRTAVCYLTPIGFSRRHRVGGGRGKGDGRPNCSHAGTVSPYDVRSRCRTLRKRRGWDASMHERAATRTRPHGRGAHCFSRRPDIRPTAAPCSTCRHSGRRRNTRTVWCRRRAGWCRSSWTRCSPTQHRHTIELGRARQCRAIHLTLSATGRTELVDARDLVTVGLRSARRAVNGERPPSRVAHALATASASGRDAGSRLESETEPSQQQRRRNSTASRAASPQTKQAQPAPLTLRT